MRGRRSGTFLAMPTPPRMIVDRYRVLEEAGRGGMGSVWRCVDERLGREVAVKQVGRMPGESVTDRARALREARSSAALNHRNVVSIYDAIAEGDHLWLVMEYVPGRTLGQIVRQEGPLPPERVAWIGAQVADGLAAAHERGTVHRDVKPGNVLVRDDDSAQISDFGIARTAGDDTLTQTGMVTGTPAYFAPEIARGGDPTPASDVWALGATLFTAVEGEPPYGTNPNALALLSTIAVEDPAPPTRAGPLTEPIRRMLDPDPAARWSMTDVAHALHGLHDPQAPPVDTREHTPVIPVPAPPPPRAEPPAAPEAEPAPVSTSEQRRRRGGPVLVVGLVMLIVVAIALLALLRGDPGETPSAEDSTGPSSSAGASDETDPGASGSSATTETETTEPTETAPAGGGGRSAFVEDYYATLPDDTEAGYAMLAPSYQEETSYQSYEGFWSTVDEVDVLDSAPAGTNAVDVTLLYDGDDEEVRRIFLERDGDAWLIADDEIIG